MKVYVFVEGPADRVALEALWRGWCERLRQARHGIAVIPLEDKSRYLRKIGLRAAEKLVASTQDVVVGLPDLYPNSEFQNSQYRHGNLAELQEVQRREVAAALRDVYRIRSTESNELMLRFYPSALKHDLEMLLLAAKEQLRAYLRTPDQLGSWRSPVEDQNQQQPPRVVVEGLFLSKRGWRYRDTLHAPAVLRRVQNIKDILHNENHQLQCPAFKDMLDWIGVRTAVAAY